MKNQKILLYTIIILTVLTTVAVLISNLFETGDTNFREWGLAAVLAEIIGLFVIIVRSSFKGKEIAIFLAVPENHSRSINWDYENCFLISGQQRERIGLTIPGIGPGFRVHFDQDVLSKNEHGIVEFELRELNGTRWRVGPFNLYDHTRNLENLDSNLSIVDYD